MRVYQRRIFTIVFFLMFYVSGNACVCMVSPTLGTALKTSEVVVSGRVIKVDTIREVDYFFHSKKGFRTKHGKLKESWHNKFRYSFIIDSVLKGTQKVRDTITLLVPDSDCKPFIFVGLRHLISADYFVEKRLKRIQGKKNRFETTGITRPEILDFKMCNYYQIFLNRETQ